MSPQRVGEVLQRTCTNKLVGRPQRVDRAALHNRRETLGSRDGGGNEDKESICCSKSGPGVRSGPKDI